MTGTWENMPFTTLMYNAPEWSDAVCLTILRCYRLKGITNIMEASPQWIISFQITSCQKLVIWPIEWDLYSGPKVWNMASVEIKDNVSFSLIKRKLQALAGFVRDEFSILTIVTSPLHLLYIIYLLLVRALLFTLLNFWYSWDSLFIETKMIIFFWKFVG